MVDCENHYVRKAMNSHGGVWPNRDPIGDQAVVIRLSYPKSFAFVPVAERKAGPNLYWFAWNSPVLYFDPDGHECLHYGPGATCSPPDLDPSRCKGFLRGVCEAACGAAGGLCFFACPESGPAAGLCFAACGAAEALCWKACDQVPTGPFW